MTDRGVANVSEPAGQVCFESGAEVEHRGSHQVRYHSPLLACVNACVGRL